MPLDTRSSERLGVLRLPLIVGVVFIHAYGTEVGFSEGSVGLSHTGFVVDFVRNLISQGVARLAVPLFFLLSGYLFFLGFSLSWRSYREKLRSRSKSLLVPYLFWNLATLAVFALAQTIPATRIYFSGNNPLIAGFGVYDYLNAVFGIDRQPIAYQFWFIRDLMVLVLMSPIIALILRWTPRLFLAAMGVLWYVELWPLYVPSVAALAFFSLGAGLGANRISLFSLDRFGRPVGFAYLCVLLVDATTKGAVFNPYVHKAGIVLGVVWVLYLTQGVMALERLKRALLWAGGASFFIFAFHEPTQTILRKLAYKLTLPDSVALILFLYLSIPLVVLALSLLLYSVMKRFVPGFLKVISGGR